MGCPIRIFTDQWLFAPTHDFSQLITSFFASESPGIRHAPLFTFLVGVFLPKPVGNEIQTYTKALLLFCSVLVLLFESYVFQYVNERFDLCGRGGCAVVSNRITWFPYVMSYIRILIVRIGNTSIAFTVLCVSAVAVTV